MPNLWITPAVDQLLILLAVGVVTLFAQYSIVHAYQFAEVHVLAPFEYIVILWALLFGWLLFSEVPTLIMLLGCAIVITSGLLVASDEKKNATLISSRLTNPEDA